MSAARHKQSKMPQHARVEVENRVRTGNTLRRTTATVFGLGLAALGLAHLVHSGESANDTPNMRPAGVADETVRSRPQDQARIKHAMDVHIPTGVHVIDTHEFAGLPHDSRQYDIVKVFTDPNPYQHVVSAGAHQGTGKQPKAPHITVNGKTVRWGNEIIEGQEGSLTKGGYWTQDRQEDGDNAGTIYVHQKPGKAPGETDLYIPSYYPDQGRTIAISVHKQAQTLEDGGVWTSEASQNFGELIQVDGRWTYNTLPTQHVVVDSSFTPN